jgi:hypothetical protein
MAKPIRPQIFSPLVTRGVYDRDLPYVYGGTLFVLAFSFWLDLKVYRVPLPVINGLGAYLLLMAFFAWTRVGRPPLWFPHFLFTMVFGTVRRKLLRRDFAKTYFSTWFSSPAALLEKKDL